MGRDECLLERVLGLELRVGVVDRVFVVLVRDLSKVLRLRAKQVHVL